MNQEQAIEMELYNLGEAIGSCLELNDDFLDKYCGQGVGDLLRVVPYEDRAFVLEGNIGEGEEVGYVGNSPDSILLPIDEIEIQIESIDDLEDPEEWTVNGDCAYTTMVGTRFRVDLDGLRQAIANHMGVE